MSQELLNGLIGALVTFISGLLTTVILPTFVKWMSARTHNQAVLTVMNELAGLAQTSVEHIEQTIVWELKESGKWDADSQRQALALAVNECLTNISTKTTKLLSKDGIDLEGLIIRYVEAYIGKRNS